MKNLKIFSAVLILIVGFNLSSCTSDNEPIDPTIVITPDPDPDPNPEAGVFKVDIDGTTYTAAQTMVYITGGSIQLSAIRAQGDAFGILLQGNTAGTYQTNENLISYTPAGSEYGYMGYNPDDMNASTGSIVVTAIDNVNHTMSGTFSYTGYWSDDTDNTPPAPKHFTNGVFTNLPYVTMSPTNDTFVAKVNGVDFNQNDLLAITTQISGTEIISIGANNAAGKNITVSVKSSLGTGTYNITAAGLATDGVQIEYAVNDTDFGTPATAGSVIITSKTATRIKGTFIGTVTINSVVYQITNGSFDVEY